MTVRYGVLLVPQPSFTARVYRARQLICGQYGAWAAEMQMVHLAVSGFFQCTDSEVPVLDAGLKEVAALSRRDMPQLVLSNGGVNSFPGDYGNIFLDFASVGDAGPFDVLRGNVVCFLNQAPGVVRGLLADGPIYRPHLPLMQYARLPADVFSDATEFARAVVADLGVPATTRAWRLPLVRFHSEAAGDDWSGGGWAADLSWELLSSHPL